MKIISWNVNGIRAAEKKGLLEYITREQPDIFCIQETKAEPSQLSEALKAPPGYVSFFNSSRARKGYSGVATYSKIPPIAVNHGFGLEVFDIEGRVIESDHDDFVLFNVYFPNGGRGDERVKYKLDFYEALFRRCEKLRKKGKKIIVSGDYNTAHKEIDLARPKENEKVSGFMSIEREWIDRIVTMGYVDSFRMFNDKPGEYSYWDQITRARERNVGWRIDYHFVTSEFAQSVKSASIQPHILGSDHCPVVIELK